MKAVVLENFKLPILLLIVLFLLASTACKKEKIDPNVSDITINAVVDVASEPCKYDISVGDFKETGTFTGAKTWVTKVYRNQTVVKINIAPVKPYGSKINASYNLTPDMYNSIARTQYSYNINWNVNF